MSDKKVPATTATSFTAESKAAGVPYSNVTVINNQKLEPDLYKSYLEQYLDNPLCTLLIDYLVDEIAGNYDIVPGPQGSDADVEKVREFFYLNGTESQLKELTLQGVLFGNGFGQREMKGNALKPFDPKKPYEPSFKRIDAGTILIERDSKGTETFTQQVGDKTIKLKREDILAIRLKRLPNTPYGVSFIRSSLPALQALSELVRDIPAAIKNISYNHRLAKLDLDGYDTVDEKIKAINEFTDSFNRVDPASNGVITIDKEHDVGWMANIGGQGGNQSRMMPMMDFIEPLLSFTMLNLLMALGHIQQTGANKAIIDAQEQKVKERLANIKAEWARTIDLELLQYIVGGPMKVRLEHRGSKNDVLREREVMIEEYKLDLISREYYHQQADIFDDGSELFSESGAAKLTQKTETSGGNKNGKE